MSVNVSKILLEYYEINQPSGIKVFLIDDDRPHHRAHVCMDIA